MVDQHGVSDTLVPFDSSQLSMLARLTTKLYAGSIAGAVKWTWPQRDLVARRRQFLFDDGEVILAVYNVCNIALAAGSCRHRPSGHLSVMVNCGWPSASPAPMQGFFPSISIEGGRLSCALQGTGPMSDFIRMRASA